MAMEASYHITKETSNGFECLQVFVLVAHNDSTDLAYHSQEGRLSSGNSDRGPSSPRHSNEQPPPVSPKPVSPMATPSHYASGQVRATYDFVARNSKELTIMAGEVLDVFDNKRRWWEVRNSSGQTGFVPSTILEAIHPSSGSSGQNLNFNHSNSSFEPAPLPSPPLSNPSNHSRELISQAEVHAPPP
ncbi:putative epidermal growth factor receptor kinase substrate 8-like, partial [Apostichopus japonicus]